MDLKGRIVKLLPLVTGQGKNGEWKKQEFILETEGQYPKKVCFEIWSEKIDQFKPNEGQEVLVSFDAESREYNERWFTSLRVWKIDANGATSPSADTNTRSNKPAQSDAPIATDDVFVSTQEDDLPF